MFSKAVWKYFLEINMFNVLFSFIVGLVSGFMWSFVMFASFGVLIGFLIHQFFKKNEYYTYYNLGYTKKNLLMKIWVVNAIISSLMFLTYLIVR